MVAISGFGIFLGITFNEDADTLQLAMHGPIEVLIGLSFGIFWGLLAQWIPDKNHPHVSFFRWLIVFAGGLIALYGAHLIHYDGAGGLAAILLSLIASMQWRKEGWGEHNPVSDIFNKVLSKSQENYSVETWICIFDHQYLQHVIMDANKFQKIIFKIVTINFY